MSPNDRLGDDDDDDEGVDLSLGEEAGPGRAGAPGNANWPMPAISTAFVDELETFDVPAGDSVSFFLGASFLGRPTIIFPPVSLNRWRSM